MEHFLLAIFGDIDFVHDVAYIKKIYKVQLFSSSDEMEETCEAILDEGVYDGWVCPQEYGEVVFGPPPA
jgi:hypothetical protein